MESVSRALRSSFPLPAIGGWLLRMVIKASGKITADTSATSQHTQLSTSVPILAWTPLCATFQALHKPFSVNWLNRGELCSVGLYGYNTFKACKHAWDYSAVDNVICMQAEKNSFKPFKCLTHPKEIPSSLLLPNKCQGSRREGRTTYPCPLSTSHLEPLYCHHLAASSLASCFGSPQIVPFKEFI